MTPEQGRSKLAEMGKTYTTVKSFLRAIRSVNIDIKKNRKTKRLNVTQSQLDLFMDRFENGVKIDIPEHVIRSRELAEILKTSHGIEYSSISQLMTSLRRAGIEASYRLPTDERISLFSKSDVQKAITGLKNLRGHRPKAKREPIVVIKPEYKPSKSAYMTPNHVDDGIQMATNRMTRIKSMVANELEHTPDLPPRQRLKVIKSVVANVFHHDYYNRVS